MEYIYKSLSNIYKIPNQLFILNTNCVHIFRIIVVGYPLDSGCKKYCKEVSKKLTILIYMIFMEGPKAPSSGWFGTIGAERTQYTRSVATDSVEAIPVRHQT